MIHFGQHFLVNQSVLKKIAGALDVKKNDVIIEIGAGHGELTGELVNWLIGKNREEKVILIEKDNTLTESLRKKYGENKKIEIINGDVLKILPNLISQSANKLINYKLVGNIPYYITGRLLRLISELDHKPSRCVFTIQKEVAERLTKRPPQMNRLAASVQFWAKPELVGYVSRNDFEPKPEVDSAIVVLATRVRGSAFAEAPAVAKAMADKSADRQKSSNITPERYYRTVRILFQQPRKTILNNLADGTNPVRSKPPLAAAAVPLKAGGRTSNGTKTKKEMLAKKLSEIGIDPSTRPQNLSVEDIVRVAGIVGH